MSHVFLSVLLVNNQFGFSQRPEVVRVTNWKAFGFYLRTVYLTKAEFAEKKAQHPPLRSNATAAAQAARATAIQDLERELEQALTFIDTQNESVMLLKIRSDLRRPVLRRKMDLIAQQGQQAEEARAREAAQRAEVEREANRDALVAVVQRPPAALPEALPDNALPVYARPNRQLPEQYDAQIRGEPAQDHVGQMIVQQQPTAVPPFGWRPHRTGHSSPIAKLVPHQATSLHGHQLHKITLLRGRAPGNRGR